MAVILDLITQVFNVADPVCEYKGIRIRMWRKAGYGPV